MWPKRAYHLVCPIQTPPEAQVGPERKLTRSLSWRGAQEDGPHSKVDLTLVQVFPTILYARMLKLTSTVLFVFAIAYLPCVTMIIYRCICGSTAFLNTYIYQWTEMFALGNTLWNPLICKRTFCSMVLHLLPLRSVGPKGYSHGSVTPAGPSFN